MDPAFEMLYRRGYRDFADAVTKLDAEADAQAGKWIREGKNPGLWPSVAGAWSAFRRTYYKEGGRQAGVPGLFVSVNDGMRVFLAYAKYWEMKTGAGKKGIPS
jgi:hypothetical protein